MHNRVALALMALALLGGLASAEDTWVVSGTLASSTVEDGTAAFLRLIDPGAQCRDPRPPRYSTSAVQTDGKAHYTIEGVVEGEYTVCAFFDLVTEEGPGRLESGDLGSIKTVKVRRDTRVDFGEDAFVRLP